MLTDSPWPLFQTKESPLWAAVGADDEPPFGEPPEPPLNEPSDEPPPRTLYARIKFLLSEEGRRDSLRKGGNGKRNQETGGWIEEGDLSSFTVGDDGQVSFDATGGFGPLDFPIPAYAHWKMTSPVDDELHWDQVPTWDDLMSIVRGSAQAIAAVQEENKQAEQRRAKIADDFLSDPSARATRLGDDWVTVDGLHFPKGHKVAIEARRRLEQDQEALRKANRATLAKWITQNGTDNQRQRLQAGLLPWAEAHNTLEEHLYAPLADFPLYQRFNEHQVCKCHFDDYGDPNRTCKVKFKSVDATELNSQEWDQFCRIKALVPNGNFQLREHTAECESALPVMRRGVIVKFTIDSLTIKRQFALTEVES